MAATKDMQKRHKVELVAAGYAQTRGRSYKSPRTGKAFYGCTLRCSKAVKVIHGTLRTKSETRAELAGIVEGLKRLKNSTEAVTVYTANRRLREDLSEMNNRKVCDSTHNWVPERNSDLWHEFQDLANRFKIKPAPTNAGRDVDYQSALEAAKRNNPVGEVRIESPSPNRYER